MQYDNSDIIFSSSSDSLFIEDEIPTTIGGEPDCSASTLDTDFLSESTNSSFSSLQVQVAVPKTILGRIETTAPVTKSKKEDMDSLLSSVHTRQSRRRLNTNSKQGRRLKTPRVSPRRERTRAPKTRERKHSLDEHDLVHQRERTKISKTRERKQSLNEHDLVHQRDRRQLLRTSSKSLSLRW